MTSPAKPWAIVTGAAQGIGLATAAALRDAGYRVSCWDLDADRLARGLSSIGDDDLHGVVCDVTDEAAITAAVASLADEGIAVLVNNAAWWEPHGPLMGLRTESWSADLDRLLTSNQRVARAVTPHMRTGAAIVGLSSVHGLTGSENWGTYDVAKAAIVQWTRVVALELAPRGIRVNAVAPGIIAPSGLPAYTEDPALEAFHTGVTPLGRIGRPEDVANLIVFLAGPGAGFITGQTIVIDGGLTTRMALTVAEVATQQPSVATGGQGAS